MKSGYGKTYQLIKKASISGDYIVCHSFDEAHRIRSIAKENKLDIRLPLTYDEFLKGEYYGTGVSGFLIDNVEMLLQSITNVPINAITLNY